MFTPFQVILVCVYWWLFTLVSGDIQLINYAAEVFHGLVCGLIMGDVKTGLEVGATMCLMGMGIGGFGGASVPNYQFGALTGTVFAISSGQGLEAGLAIGIPIATLGTEFDMLSKMAGSFFLHKQIDMSHAHRFNEMGKWIWAWKAFKATFYTLPVLLGMTAGAGLINNLLNSIPGWLMKGLNTAAGALPAVGLAILLKYMNLKKWWVWLVFGYIMVSYFGQSMLSTALLAMIAAILTFKYLEDRDSRTAVVGAAMGGDDYDE
ncbi:MAG: PTS sugar transporter subunit IIC [Erysipelotrichaceae bacterium]|nr:PTS sugar transporter subunit IIC [Erysipelotrichaceae bacterium]